MNPDFIFLGDFSKYTCLSNLLNIDIFSMRANSIYISYGNDFSIALKKNCYFITTYKIIPNTTVFIPTDDYNLEQLVKNIDSKYVIFEEFPFIKASTQNLIEQLESLNICIVLVDSNKFVASTDLNKKGEDFSEAKQYYLEEKIKIISIDDINNFKQIKQIFYWRNRLKEYYLNRATKYLQEIKEYAQNIKYDYKLILEDWNIDKKYLQEIKRICSYENVKKINEEKNINSIWNIYMLEGYHKLFPSNKIGGIYDILSLYEDIMKDNSLVVWAIKKDQDILLNRLCKKYWVSIGDIQYDNCNNREFLEDEIKYLRCISEPESKLYGINIRFLKKFDRYVNEEILSVLEDFLNNKYSNLEKQLKSLK